MSSWVLGGGPNHVPKSKSNYPLHGMASIKRHTWLTQPVERENSNCNLKVTVASGMAVRWVWRFLWYADMTQNTLGWFNGWRIRY